MELGAVVLIPESLPVQERAAMHGTSPGSSAQPLPLWPVVGRNLVQEWINRIKEVGVKILSVVQGVKPIGAEPVQELARDGVEQFLVVSLQSYAEIDLLDFVRYHRECRNPATVAFNQDGPLGVEILSRTSLTWRRASSGCSSAPNTRTSEYRFHGYAKHLRTAKGYCDLVADALSRQCALTPRGSQFGPHTWVAESARIDRAVCLRGPCFVGADTVLRQGVTVGPFSSIEDGSVVECGTIIEESTILPQTFVAAGLCLRRSVVDGPQLEQLDSGVVVNLSSAGLARRLPRRAKSRAHSNSGHLAHVCDTPTASGVSDSRTRLVARTAGWDDNFANAV